MTTPQRLVFGEAAELYDRHRPSYPPKLVDALIALAGLEPGERVLEVGAGTGKATAMFAARGLAVVAIEPSAGMAAVARRNLAGAGAAVEIVESDFERWDPGEATFRLLYSAQAWHWLDPARRFALARRALAPGGVLAAFWNRPAWGESELRDALRAIYARIVPEISTEWPLHPASEWTVDADEGWDDEVATAGGFTGASRMLFPWSVEYASQEYGGLLATLSDIRLLDVPVRERLIAAVTDAVQERGGSITMPMVTVAHLARAA